MSLRLKIFGGRNVNYIGFLSLACLIIASSFVQANTPASESADSKNETPQIANPNNDASKTTAELRNNVSQSSAENPDSSVAIKTNGTNNKQDGSREFAGLRFGVGLSLTVDSGTRQRVESAELVNGVVRITNENDALARIMLESHYFFTPGFDFGLSTDGSPFGVKAGSWGWGPFVSVQPGSKEIIEAIGFGLMLGFKRNGEASDPDSSWNIGIGYVVDPNVQVLGDGITANAVLPEGEDALRFKEVSQSGYLVLISFSF